MVIYCGFGIIALSCYVVYRIAHVVLRIMDSVKD